MLKELEVVALVVDKPDHGLVAGDFGTVVDVSPDGKNGLVEFTTIGGDTIAIVDVAEDEITPVAGDEYVNHARRRSFDQSRTA
jgi:hypothetical protein